MSIVKWGLAVKESSWRIAKTPVKRSQPFKPQSIGGRIAHARRLLGVREGHDVAVSEIAERVGVSAASVYNWEGDVFPPGERNVKKLAEVLGVSAAYIRYGVEGAPPTVFTQVAGPATKRGKGA